MRLALPLLLTALALPVAAQQAEPTLPADIFAHLAANRWAFPDVDTMRCDENPHTIAFNEERSLSWFDWYSPMTNYLGETDQQGVYDVIESDESSITMYLHDEQRRTDEGSPVVWILRLIDGGEAYCWDRTDWSPPRCTHLHIRCQPPAPIS
ncbi:hypothetical protein [Oceanicola sp. 502str15]|uniref:hypothetical protein n=1 Tax=Oceanicola sp. 502str15 TaxID=2696061 RepID=UPI002094A7B5|nr:hypothetical protein [Oceanicola sp. 502str15]MCO6385088.1 hypothetical protein [Oceanicola sp. 502str15]